MNRSALDNPSPGVVAFRYHAVDLLRAMACLWVFSVHLPPPRLLIEAWPVMGPILGIRGYSFLTFFVISGLTIYLATQSSMSRGEPSHLYLWRRLVRVLPPYWVSIPVVMAIPFLVEIISAVRSGQVVWPQPGYLAYSWQDWLHIIFLTRIFLIPEGDQPSSVFQAINSPMWALAVVVQFYVFMAVVRQFLPRRVALALASLMAAGMLAVAIPGSWVKGWMFYYGVAFGAGGLLGAAIRHGWTPTRLLGATVKPLNPVILLTGAGLAGAAMFSLDALGPWRGPLFCLGLTLALWSLYQYDHLVGRLRQTRIVWLRPISTVLFTLCAMSFTIYLLHGKMYWLGMLVARRVADPDSGLFMLLTMVVTILLCYPFHRWVEKPLTASSKSKPAPRAADVSPAVAPIPSPVIAATSFEPAMISNPAAEPAVEEVETALATKA